MEAFDFRYIKGEKMKISIVIPCYNSEKNIHKVISEITETMKQRADYECEIVLVNDYSKDQTWKVISEIAKEDNRVKAINLARNFGQPSAILAGFSYVTGDYIFVSDDDGQTPVCQMFELLDELENNNYDVVCGKYTQREQPSLFRRFGSKMNEKMSDWLIQKPKGVYMSAFLCARPFVVKEMLNYKHSYPYLAGLILRTTQNIGNVEVQQRERDMGTSNYTIKKLFFLWLNGFTAFSIKPLRVAVLFGVFFSASGFLMALALIIRKLLDFNVQVGWSSIISVMLVIAGITLLFLGMIGEYIGRIYMCINEAPQFIVREIEGNTEE